LDIDAGAPLILIPHSSRTKDVLVLDLGKLRVKNTFLFDGAEGTTSHKRAEQREEKSSRKLSEQDAVRNLERDGHKSGDAATKADDVMNQSVYGSLDTDWRFPPGATSPQIPQPKNSAQAHSNRNVLSSFYSAFGSGTAVVASSSVGRSPADPKFTTSYTPTTFHTTTSGAGAGPALSARQESVDYKCLLDVTHIQLVDMEVYSARWSPPSQPPSGEEEITTSPSDLQFPSFVIQRESGKILKEKCRLCLQVERNLDGDISHAVPDFSVDGKLSSVCLTLDVQQYQLVRGLLAHNFGEQCEEFQRQLMLHLKDPRIQTVLTGQLFVGFSVNLELDGVLLELLLAHEDTGCREVSLARFDFMRSRLLFESRTDGSKDIDLVSHEIKVHDTRYRDNPANVRPNIFSEILKPSSSDGAHGDSLQLELHCRTNKDCARYTVLLNNMRVLGVFDWIMAVSDFLSVGPEDPFKKDKEDAAMEQLHAPASNLITPTNCGSILTKRIPVAEKKEQLLEVCLNMTDTELVVVEDAAYKDTNAIILSGTTLLMYREANNRPLSFSLQGLEVFSCSLSAEDETALSIIDPMSLLLELNNSPATQDRKISGGLLDAASCVERPPILEASFQTLTIRLSYNDIRLFTAILNSMPQQFLRSSDKHSPPDRQLTTLQDLGFAASDCERALGVCQGRIEEAAIWLTKNATTVVAADGPSKPARLNISGFEIKEGSISVCLIDDCLDADVPLLELLFTDINVLHKFRPQGQGHAKFRLHGDYYNRLLSGWEPFIENWLCNVAWHEELMPDDRSKLHLDVNSPNFETLNLNVTSTLLELFTLTKAKWTEDYAKSCDQKDATYNSRRRVPFIPFAIRNHTGSDVRFSTITSMPTRMQESSFRPDDLWKKNATWRDVAPSCELPFLIDEREKIRHKHTHELKVHQLVLKVDGWETVAPVSVDKVGVYFRRAERDSSSQVFRDLPPARIVFEVTIEGSARKVITVRSPILLDNQLEDAVEVKLDCASGATTSNKSLIMRVESKTRMALPLRFIHSTMSTRPVGWSLTWCAKPISWQAVTRAGEVQNTMHSCDTRGADKDTYRFCVSVYRQHFPDNLVPSAGNFSSHDLSAPYVQPGHVITITPPLRIENLLPIDVNYTLKVGAGARFEGTIKPGKMNCHVGVDLNQYLQLGLTLENYPTCRELMIPAGTVDYRVKMCLQDTMNRQLELIVIIKARLGGSLQLSILAPYWLVNKSGLPLIFKEDGSSTIAAGQFDEHEIARSVMPLLFCFTEKENSYCSMKLGKSVHGPGTVPQWCSRFRLIRGITVSQVHVAQPSRPDWVYNIGIEVRPGRGRYSETSVVRFTPRYQLDNRSRHKLAYAQRHLAKTLAMSDFLTALPNCVLPFHWPRVDFDTLLCVRLMDLPTCSWSGGFLIDAVDSFHINMRDEFNRCVFLRVDVVLQGATYVAVFTDADQMPPPYRIDNFAEVPVMFYQSRVTNEKLKTYIKPRTSLPYAWDEPTLLRQITLKVPSGTSGTYDLDAVYTGECEKLCYENFIYIAFTHTFKNRSPKSTNSAATKSSSTSSHADYRTFVESQELVLDVVTPNMVVVLKKKEPGKRSQLWRMSSTGMLTHEGSSVPRDPRNPTYSSSVVYVLDIKDIALQPNRDMPLTLRKPDDRRRSTQIWKFVDGQLCCGEKAKLFVQAKDGIFGLRDGGEAVLGPVTPVPKHPSNYAELPPETAIHRDKLQPGSGYLVIKVSITRSNFFNFLETLQS